MTTTETRTAAEETPTEAEMTAAIEKLDQVYGSTAGEMIALIEVVSDDETIHEGERAGDGRGCTKDCTGCLTERIAFAVTRAVNATT